jgi:hypothetical protein
MSGLYTCFNSINTIASVSYNQRSEYKAAWNSFQTVELYNSNVSTLRGQGDKSVPYYQYPTCEAQTQYKKGAALFEYYLGYTALVQKN